MHSLKRRCAIWDYHLKNVPLSHDSDTPQRLLSLCRNYRKWTSLSPRLCHYIRSSLCRFHKQRHMQTLHGYLNPTGKLITLPIALYGAIVPCFTHIFPTLYTTTFPCYACIACGACACIAVRLFCFHLYRFRVSIFHRLPTIRLCLPQESRRVFQACALTKISPLSRISLRDKKGFKKTCGRLAVISFYIESGTLNAGCRPLFCSKRSDNSNA